MDRRAAGCRAARFTIDTFREAGFVIKKSGDCIRLDKESPHFRDISQLVHFTEEEAVILKSAIENIDDDNLLKQNLKRKLYSVYDNRTLADTVVRGRNAPNIRRLIEAIETAAEGFMDRRRRHERTDPGGAFSPSRELRQHLGMLAASNKLFKTRVSARSPATTWAHTPGSTPKVSWTSSA